MCSVLRKRAFKSVTVTSQIVLWDCFRETLVSKHIGLCMAGSVVFDRNCWLRWEKYYLSRFCEFDSLHVTKIKDFSKIWVLTSNHLVITCSILFICLHLSWMHCIFQGTNAMQPGQAGALRQSKSKRQKNTDSSSPKAVKVEIWKIEGFQKILLKKNIRKHEKYEVNTCEYNRLQWSE